MPEKPHYLGHRKRLRERFEKSSADGLQDYEILELLLGYAIPRRDVKPIAKDLMRKFGGFSGVLDADLKALEAVAGLGERSAMLLKLVKEVSAAYLGEKMREKDFLSSPEAVVDFARMKLAGLPQECFMIVHLNTKNEVIAHEVLQEGTIYHAVIYPRKIVESALERRAANLILVHNHPSGHCEPSPEDKRITRELALAVKSIEVKILDHLIVGKAGHFSFAENGLI